jgi:hypothetical protein
VRVVEADAKAEGLRLARDVGADPAEPDDAEALAAHPRRADRLALHHRVEARDDAA